MAPMESNTQKRPPGLVRSLSQRFLRAGRNSPANSTDTSQHQKDVSKEPKKRVEFKRPTIGKVITMRAIIEPAKNETLSHPDSAAHVKKSLAESEKRVSTLRYILDDFTTALANSRDEAKETERRKELAKAQTRQAEEGKKEMDSQEPAQTPAPRRVPRHADLVASLKRQATLSEREMCGLLAELTSAQDDIDSYQSEIAAINNNIAAIAATSRDLARKNMGLARDNTALNRQLDAISEVTEPDGSVRAPSRWGRQVSMKKPKTVAIEGVRIRERAVSQAPKRRRLVF